MHREAAGSGSVDVCKIDYGEAECRPRLLCVLRRHINVDGGVDAGGFNRLAPPPIASTSSPHRYHRLAHAAPPRRGLLNSPPESCPAAGADEISGPRRYDDRGERSWA